MLTVLGSQSPRRFELLQQIIATDELTVLPPKSADEPGFEGLTRVSAIESQLRNVVQLKLGDVVEQLQQQGRLLSECCVICADTIVVARGSNDLPVVLGKPPMPHWQATVRDWFRNYYSGRTHEVWTGCVIAADDKLQHVIVKTHVTMCSLQDELIDWYVSTEEPIGKAGGYGLQGAAAMLIDAVDGSLTNVIGLPLREVRQTLKLLNASQK